MDQFELYFKRADLDQDGRVNGPEAVSFFQASGLPKPVLAQIWTIADQKRTGYLGRTEFYNYLKLVTVVQSKQDLTPDIVKAALYGPGSAKIPPPQINLGALPASRSNLNGGPPTPHTGIIAPPPASQVTGPPQSPLPNATFQSQHGANHVTTGGGMMSASRPGVPSQPPTKGIINNPSMPMDVSSSGSALSAQATPHGPANLVQNTAPKPNGFSSNDSFSSASSHARNIPVGTTSSVTPPNVPTSGGTQLVKPSQPSQNNAFQQPTVIQNQQMQPAYRNNNQQVPSHNSSTLPVRAESVASSQFSQAWPKMSHASIQKYTKVFMDVDTDRDGKVTGEQARNLFLSWRLPREILKQVWDLSDQDNDSMLSLKEFCIALYLMERFREGRPLPKVLPPNIFEGTPPLPQSGQAPGAPSWRPQLGTGIYV